MYFTQSNEYLCIVYSFNDGRQHCDKNVHTVLQIIVYNIVLVIQDMLFLFLLLNSMILFTMFTRDPQP